MIFNPQAKLVRHIDRLESWFNTDRCNPILVEIAPTGFCNAKCSWCSFKDKHTNEKIKTSTLLGILDDLPRLGVRAINWTGGGEPTLHPDFTRFVEYAERLGIKVVQIK